jgi:Rho-binding antiterminator
MGHNIEPCDFIDMFEESEKLRRPVRVTVPGDKHFTDLVKQVVTEEGQDFVLFRDHGRIPVTDVLDCVFAEAPRQGYDSKL